MLEVELKTKEEILETINKFTKLCSDIAEEYGEVEFIGPEIILKKSDTSFNILMSAQTYELIKDSKETAASLSGLLKQTEEDLDDEIYLLSQIEDGLKLLTSKVSGAIKELEEKEKKKPNSVCEITMGTEDIYGLAGFWATLKYVRDQVNNKIFKSIANCVVQVKSC